MAQPNNDDDDNDDDDDDDDRAFSDGYSIVFMSFIAFMAFIALAGFFMALIALRFFTIMAFV
jgi:hypothetical protein